MERLLLFLFCVTEIIDRNDRKNPVLVSRPEIKAVILRLVEYIRFAAVAVFKNFTQIFCHISIICVNAFSIDRLSAKS